MVPVERSHCSVTAILVLYGLLRLLTGSILAHEVMHAYLKLNNITGLSQKVEEGVCQLMALIWLERQHPQVCVVFLIGSYRIPSHTVLLQLSDVSVAVFLSNVSPSRSHVTRENAKQGQYAHNWLCYSGCIGVDGRAQHSKTVLP